MTEEGELNIFWALDFIRDKAPEYAQAKANRIYVEELRKVRKAELMKKAELDGHKAGNTQEREAYSMPEYHEVLLALYEAVQQEETLRWRLIAAQARIEAWRTLESNKRAESRAL